MDDYVSFEKSKDFNAEKKITNQDECANKHVVVIPVPVQNHGFLRTNSQCPPKRLSFRLGRSNLDQKRITNLQRLRLLFDLT